MPNNHSKYNNIFNKKNIEYTLDGVQDRLPYTAENDVKIKANQIIFTAINNVFQRLLDNDLYNEAILKKYIEYGLIGGPTYVSSINQVEDSSFLNRKFVVSGENGISVLRKEEADVSNTLSGRYLDGTKVNKITFIDEKYVACTENGIYESLDKINWNRRIGHDGIDVVDISYNQNFLNDNVVSAYDYIAIANSGNNTIFYGHNGTNGNWIDFSSSTNLSAISIKNTTATSIFSFVKDPRLYVGTKTKGLLASTLLSSNSIFTPELGTNSWTVYDMTEIPNADSYENYMLATNYGIKQSRKEYGFGNFKNPFSSNAYIYDALKDSNTFYVCTGDGLLLIDHINNQYWNESLKGKSCYAITKTTNCIYVGVQDGVYILNGNGARKIGLDGKAIQKLAAFNNAVFAYDPELRKIVYSSNNSAFETFDLTFDEDEDVKQIKRNQNTLYVLTNKAVYAIMDGTAQQMFMWNTSFAANENVYFAQNLSNGSVVVQVNRILYVLTEGNVEAAQISVELESPTSKVSSAIVSEDNYFFLIDNKLYRLFNDGVDYRLEAVLVNQTYVFAKKIAFYNDNATFTGIVLLNERNEIELLQYDNVSSALLPISGTEKFEDLIVYKDGIYAFNSSASSQTITKYSPTEQFALNEVVELTANDGVSLQQYSGEAGLIKNRSLIGNAYLSTFDNSVSLRLQSGLEATLTAFNDLTASGADFIGYVQNLDKKNTLLVGIKNENVKGYNVDFDSALTAIETIDEIDIKDSPQNPTAFADISYRNALGLTVNAINFIGTENGLYAISATKKFIEEAIPENVNKINDVLITENVEDTTVYIGTDSGIYQFYPNDSKNFINAGYENNVKTLSKAGNIIIANSNGNNMLISSTFGDAVTWNSMFDSTNADNSFTTIENTEEVDLSSNFGCMMFIKPKTISFANEEKQNIDETILFDNVYEYTLNNGVYPNELMSIYKKNGTVKATDISGNVYNFSFTILPNGSVSITPVLVSEEPESLTSILTNKLANYALLEKNLSIALDPESTNDPDTMLLTASLSAKKEYIEKEDSDILTNINYAKFQLLSGRISIDEWNYGSYLCCLTSIVSTSFDLANSGILSFDILEKIDVNASFLSNDNGVLSTITLSNMFSITEADNKAILVDTNSIFANAINSLPLSVTSEGITYSIDLSIGNVNYEPGHSTIDSSLSLEYALSLYLENSREIVKLMPLIKETNDNIYYDNIYWNAVLSDDLLKEEHCAGYCLSTVVDGNPIWLLLTGDELYVFNGFKTYTREENIGLTQISKSVFNGDFNDLYYFRIGNNFNEYSIRKTGISYHSKDFSEAKYSNEAGNILSVSFEGGNTLYVVKQNENAPQNKTIYYTTSDIFPEFKQVESNYNGITLYGLYSCNTYTIVAYSFGINELIADVYQQGIKVKDSLFIVDDLSKYKGMFANENNVYIELADGIYHFSDFNSSVGPNIKDLDFDLCSNVKGFFMENTAYHSKVIIGDAYLYAKENLYDFKNVGYSMFSNISEEIVDLKTLSANTSSPLLYAATKSNIYQYRFDSFDSDVPIIHSKENKNNGIVFTNIKAIYFNANNDLYILDDSDLYVYEDFTPNKQLSDCVSSVNVDFLSGDFANKITINDFDGWTPAIVKKDSVNNIGQTRRIIKRQIQQVDANAKNFVDGLGENKYLYSSNKLQRIDSEYGLKNFTLENIGTFNDWSIDNDTAFIDDSSILQIKLLGVNRISNTIKEKIFGNDSSTTSYQIIGHPTINNIFKIGTQTCLGASGNGPGIYMLGTNVGYVRDDNNYVTIGSTSITGNKELFALDFFGEDYLISYIDENVIDDDGNIIRRSLIKSSNDFYQDYLNSNYISNIGTVALASLFNRYIFISDGSQGYVYDVRNRKGSKILLSQPEQAAGGLASLLFLKRSDELGLLGYGSAFGTFDGFNDIKIYDDVDYKKYVSLANNFKRGTLIIKAINENVDFLIGTTYGLKYVYDNIMTRSFYDKDGSIAISEQVNSIEKVIDASNDEFFIVGAGNSLYEVTSLINAKFKKIFDFDVDEIVLDVFALQKNEYLIATTKGIYTTSLKYKLTNDLRRFTLDNIYEVINDELKKIIANHIAVEHKPTSIITKVNEKADNKLLFVSNEDKHKDLYDSSIANSIRVVENDIIDTIVRGGESPNDDSYVKVGIKNWAVSNLNPESTYTDDGFINAFTDANSGKRFDISTVPYIVKNWKSGLKEIYIYVPSTGTYYANNPQGISNSTYSYNAYSRQNVPNVSLLNTLPNACTILRVYLYNSYFKIKTILAAQCTGNSLPLKIYKDNVNADDAWKGVFDTVIQPSALRTLPMTVNSDVNNVRICTDDLERIHLDFSIYGTDAQAIRIIAES